MLAFKVLATIFATASFVVAAPSGSSECNTGSENCCNSVQAGSDVPSNVTDSSPGLLSIILGDVNVPIGLDCSPISVVGILSGGAGCSADPVCCSSTQPGGGGLIGINCLPISINL